MLTYRIIDRLNFNDASDDGGDVTENYEEMPEIYELEFVPEIEVFVVLPVVILLKRLLKQQQSYMMTKLIDKVNNLKPALC